MSSRSALGYRVAWGLVLLALPVICQQPQTALPAAIVSLIQEAESIELFALDAYTRDNDPEHFDKHAISASKFHGQSIYGSHVFSDLASIARIKKAIFDSTQADIHPAACFWPRHGLRFLSGPKRLDLVICFQCHQMEIYTSTGDEAATVMSAGESTLNSLLAQQGISNPSTAN